MKVLALVVDSRLLVMVVVASFVVSDDEGRHGPALTPAKATNATAKEFGKIMVMKD
jgi:hypothetical protein